MNVTDFAMLWVVSFFAVSSVAAAQGTKPPPQADIDRAVEAGARFLLAPWERDPGEHSYRGDALVFYALLAAGKGADARTGKLLKRILDTPLDGADFPVYDVGLRAMALAHADPVRFQYEIGRCAWWLVNAQTENGQWDYDGPRDAEAPKKFDSGKWSGPVPTGGKGKEAFSRQLSAFSQSGAGEAQTASLSKPWRCKGQTG